VRICKPSFSCLRLLKLAKAKPSWTIAANPGPSTGPVGDVLEEYLALAGEGASRPAKGKIPRTRVSTSVVAQELFPETPAE
jgi:hypothetical protein